MNYKIHSNMLYVYIWFYFQILKEIYFIVNFLFYSSPVFSFPKQLFALYSLRPGQIVQSNLKTVATKQVFENFRKPFIYLERLHLHVIAVLALGPL